MDCKPKHTCFTQIIIQRWITMMVKPFLVGWKEKWRKRYLGNWWDKLESTITELIITINKPLQERSRCQFLCNKIENHAVLSWSGYLQEQNWELLFHLPMLRWIMNKFQIGFLRKKLTWRLITKEKNPFSAATYK